MNLQQRIYLSGELGKYLLADGPEWQAAKEEAFRMNGWFIPSFIDLATHNIATRFLSTDRLTEWAKQYRIPDTPAQVKTVGIVMAGNIPLVGFHDFLCAFISGHRQLIKTSSKDDVLIRHLLNKLIEWEPAVEAVAGFASMLKDCDAYITTGSNNTARYFDYYFGRYPHIIRRNRTSAAILDGTESSEDLSKLADDIYLYFGLGCRNVTRLYVPEGYDFVPLLEAGKPYSYFADHNKYKNNYDYQLAILLLNKEYYMTNGSLLLAQQESLFSPISQLNYSFYTDKAAVLQQLQQEQENLQCVIHREGIPFGTAQEPALTDYADGADTLQFLLDL